MFNAAERPGKNLDPPSKTHRNPTGGSSEQRKRVQDQPHPIHRQVLRVSHDGAATKQASANVRYGSQLRAGH